MAVRGSLPNSGQVGQERVGAHRPYARHAHEPFHPCLDLGGHGKEFLDLRLDLLQVGGELLLQQGRFSFDARMVVVLGAARLQNDAFLELVAADDQGFQRRFALAGRGVAGGLQGRAKGAEHGGIQGVGFRQTALGAGEGTDPGGVGYAHGEGFGLERGDNGVLVAAGALAGRRG